MSTGTRRMPRRASPGGDERTRTADPLLAKQVLSQLSYLPKPRDISRGARTCRALSGTRTGASLRMRSAASREVASDP